MLCEIYLQKKKPALLERCPSKRTQVHVSISFSSIPVQTPLNSLIESVDAFDCEPKTRLEARSN